MHQSPIGARGRTRDSLITLPVLSRRLADALPVSEAATVGVSILATDSVDRFLSHATASHCSVLSVHDQAVLTRFTTRLETCPPFLILIDPDSCGIEFPARNLEQRTRLLHPARAQTALWATVVEGVCNSAMRRVRWVLKSSAGLGHSARLAAGLDRCLDFHETPTQSVKRLAQYMGVSTRTAHRRLSAVGGPDSTLKDILDRIIVLRAVHTAWEGSCRTWPALGTALGVNHRAIKRAAARTLGDANWREREYDAVRGALTIERYLTRILG